MSIPQDIFIYFVSTGGITTDKVVDGGSKKSGAPGSTKTVSSVINKKLNFGNRKPRHLDPRIVTTYRQTRTLPDTLVRVTLRLNLLNGMPFENAL